jgi:hypothetical protein
LLNALHEKGVGAGVHYLSVSDFLRSRRQ